MNYSRLKNNISCNGRTLATFFLVLFLFASCRGPDKPVEKVNEPDKKELLLDVNKYLVKKDRQIIRNYIERHNWDMKETSTGLFYMFLEKTDGKPVETGDQVTLAYQVSLLDGKLCYSSDSLGLKTFIAGKGGVESGLEQGLLLMKEGDRIRLVIPPHLGHGLIGDENCIPPRAIIIYEIDLLEVKKDGNVS